MGCLCASCCPCCKRECRGRNIGFNYIHPLRFSSLMWRVPPVVYFIYRVAIALFAVVSFFMWVAYPKEHNPSSDITNSMDYIDLIYIVYVTYTVYLVISAVYVVLVFNHLKMWNRTLFLIPLPHQHIALFKNIDSDLKDDPEILNRAPDDQIVLSSSLEKTCGETIQNSSGEQEVTQHNNLTHTNACTSNGEASASFQPLYHSSTKKYMYVMQQIVGILFQICTNMSIFNFFMFFLVSLVQLEHNPVLLQFSGFGFCVSIFELCTSAIPTRLLHIIYPQIFWIIGGMTYVGISFSSQELDYEGQQFIMILLFIGIFCQFFLSSIVVHFFMFGIYKLRCWILQKLYSGVMIV